MRNRTGPVRLCNKIRQSWATALCLIFVCLAAAVAQQEVTRIYGVVLDSTGAAIPRAIIEFDSNGSTIRTQTDSAGNFTLLSTKAYGTLSVSSPGFATAKIDITDVTTQPLEIRLEPAAMIERIIVNADDERIPSTSTSQFALSAREMELAGALTIDDVLRQVPGFSLFRRSGSLSANPTSQGVSLRGVGANGASRALVLLDGVPLNSPFGGWVYWNRVPRINVESVQIYNGATSDLYGSGALGGVINIRSLAAPVPAIDVEASAGNNATATVSFRAGKLFGKWGVVAA
ncbi:MAG TPA: TonB-dependent receptor, partial [Pyrinomonadaceae bacterium]|nr:TonB-dependent receptor [Pyrinomonadaceae bacterium]